MVNIQIPIRFGCGPREGAYVVLSRLYKLNSRDIVKPSLRFNFAKGFMSMKKLAGVILVILSKFIASPGFAEAGKDIVILDVRTPEEFKETHVTGARNIDFKSPGFKAEIEKLDKDKSYKLYCRSGNRSGKTLDLMKTMGFRDLENLGSVKDASEKLKIACAGEKPC